MKEKLVQWKYVKNKLWLTIEIGIITFERIFEHCIAHEPNLVLFHFEIKYYFLKDFGDIFGKQEILKINELYSHQQLESHL